MNSSRRSISRRLVAALLVSTAFAASACTTPGPVGPGPTPSASTARPDPGQLESSIEDAIARGSVALGTVEAVLVSVDGQAVLDHYRNGRGPDDVVHGWSVTKSVTSALVGIAIGDGLIASLDQTLADLLPRYRSQMSAEIAGVTLRQLMDMSAGFADERLSFSLIEDVLEHDGDAVTFILRRGLATRPGESFGYSSSASHLVTAVLAAALARADGADPRSVLDYAEAKLFRPLDIDTADAYSARVRPSRADAFERAGFGWGTDSRGVHSGCCLLRLRAGDMLKIGELYVGDGVWRGRRILPAGWVATTTSASKISSQYGLMWWLEDAATGRRSYAARGAAGQLILILPEDRVVVVVTSRPTQDYATSDDDVMALATSVILPAIR